MGIKTEYVHHKDTGGAKPTRKNLAKFAKMCEEALPFQKITQDDYAYFGFENLIDEEEAALGVMLGMRKPKTFDEIQKKSKIEPEKLRKMIDHMCEVGALEYNWENPQHEKQYEVPYVVPGSVEYAVMRRGQIEEHPEIADFFHGSTYVPAQKLTAMVPPGAPGIGMKVIPVEKAVNKVNESISIEHISHWLEKYDGQLAKSPCSCRIAHQARNEGAPDDPEYWCIAVGDIADYTVETHKGGYYITKEEAMEIFEEAEKRGFVHQISNIDGEGKIIGICNCNVNICYALRMSQLFNTPNLSRSAYVAHVNPDNCVACGQCVEHCPAGAVKLGQKLCTTAGAVEYPKHELPDETRWGKDKWDFDYTNTNRIQSYDSGTAPCKAACPAHIGIEGYLQLAKEGRYDEALELIKKDNPFPAVCGRVCNKRCEDACTRGNIDEAVSIDEVKNFLALRDLDASTRYIPEKLPHSMDRDFVEDKKIAIIGAGPAGLTCAYYLALKGYLPTVFERNERPGGMMVYGIPSFKLEKDVVEGEIEVLRQLGVEIKCGVNVGEDVTLSELREQGYEAFYLGIGCQSGRTLGIPGEDAVNVRTAVDFLHETADDNSNKISGNTVVIGGGNVAVDVARTAHRLGSEKVMMLCLESRDEMPASDDEILEAEEEGTEIRNGWGPKEILLDEDGQAKAVVFKKCVSVFDEDHKFSPKYDEEDTVTVEADQVYLSTGQCIDWGSLLEGENMEYHHGNYPKADPYTFQTSVPDIFVGGDVYSGPSFVINAIASARHAAESINRYVYPGASMDYGRDKREINMMRKDNLIIGEYDKAQRQKASYKNTPHADMLFTDEKIPFDEERVKIETARCLQCGASVVDENKCIGCGICTTHCKFDAIALSRDNPECATMAVNEDKIKKVLPYAIKREFKIIKKDIKNKFAK